MDSIREREQTVCPICGCSGLRGSFFLKGFTLAECAGCRLLYVRDRVREEVMAKFYSHEYFSNKDELSHGYKDYEEMRMEREVTFGRYLRRIVPHLERREQVLDIGCGYGYFLNAAKRYFPKLAGIDISREALERADTGYELICGEFRPELFPTGFADLVMMCDLVEHLYHPVDFLSQVREIVHPHGRICIVTPNRQSLLSRVSGKRWISFKLPEHVCYYDPQTMQQLLNRAGLKMTHHSACGQYASLGFIIKRMSYLLFGRDAVFWPIPCWLRDQLVYVNSGSMLVLAARRESR